MRHLVKRLTRAKPWVDPRELARQAADNASEMARREQLAAAAAEALLNVRAVIPHPDPAHRLLPCCVITPAVHRSADPRSSKSFPALLRM